MLRKEFLDNGIEIFQDDNLYCFTSDAILLSKFCRVKKNDTVADFCAGSGVIGFNLYALNAQLIESVTLFEMQTPLYNLSVKGIEHNKLQDKFFAVNTRLQDIDSSYAGKFSLITCNPPYMAVGNGFADENDQIAMCRTEKTLTLPELIKVVSVCLKFGGRVNLVHRADRLVEVITECKKHNIEPKRIQFVSGANKKPYLFLMEGVKGGKSGVEILSTLEN